MARSRTKSRYAGSSADQRRYLAHEIARLMWEYSIEDFRLAKDKAVKRLGMRRADLPDNREIARELKAYSALFAATEVSDQRSALLHNGHDLMRYLEAFSPRLVGVEADAVITPTTGLRLHVFSEHLEAFDLFLQEQGIDYQLDDKRFRFGPDDYDYRPTYRFDFQGMPVQVTVFGSLARSRVPLSPVDGKPMKRLSRKEVAQRLGLDE